MHFILKHKNSLIHVYQKNFYFLPLNTLLFHDQIIFKKMMLFITRSWYSWSEWEMVWVKARMKRKETEDYPKQSILNQLDRESLERSMINKHLLILWCAAQRCLMMYQKIKTHAKVITYIVIHVYNFKTIPKMFGYDTVR